MTVIKPIPRPKTGRRTLPSPAIGVPVASEARRRRALLKTGALQRAILSSANFSSIATDEKGVIQIFNVGAERMLGYAAAEVIDQRHAGRHLRPAGGDRPRARP